jgi:hypothetical protein
LIIAWRYVVAAVAFGNRRKPASKLAMYNAAQARLPLLPPWVPAVRK